MRFLWVIKGDRVDGPYLVRWFCLAAGLTARWRLSMIVSGEP
jgi:hypothetical protein